MSNRLVPRLRFKDFNGEWNNNILGHIAEVTKLAGFEFTKYVTYKNKGKIIALRGLNVKHNALNLSDVKYIDSSNLNKLKRSKLYIGDILFTYVGTVGNSAMIDQNDKYYLAPNVALIRLKYDNSNFFQQMISTDKFYRKIIYPLAATSSQMALSMYSIRNFQINYPYIQEQQKIGQFFSKLDRLIDLQSQKLSHLKQLKKGYLQKMFPQKGESVPRLRFDGFRDEWRIIELNKLTNIKDGTHSSPKKVNNGYPLITSKNLNDFGINFNDISYISKDDFEEINNRSKVNKGDIIFGMIGTIGKPVILYSEGFAIKNVALIKNNSSFNNSFLVNLLKSNVFNRYLFLSNDGGTQKFISLKKIRKFTFAIPSLQEQIQIGNLFKSINNNIENQQIKLNEIQEYKKAYLQKMFV